MRLFHHGGDRLYILWIKSLHKDWLRIFKCFHHKFKSEKKTSNLLSIIQGNTALHLICCSYIKGLIFQDFACFHILDFKTDYWRVSVTGTICTQMWSQVFSTGIYIPLRQLILLAVLELQKTKRTIVENEQLRKEVAYHTTQTEILLQQNEKLLQDLAAANRALQLAKEVRSFTWFWSSHNHPLCQSMSRSF